MALELVALLAFIIFIGSLLFMDHMDKKIMVLNAFIIGLIGVWITVSYFQPLAIHKTLEANAYNVDGSSLITYQDFNGKKKLVNLNEAMERNIEPGSKIKVTIYERMYVGLWYPEQRVPDEYEVLTTTE